MIALLALLALAEAPPRDVLADVAIVVGDDAAELRALQTTLDAAIDHRLGMSATLRRPPPAARAAIKAAVRACRGEVYCTTRAFKKAGAQLGLIVILNRETQPMLFSVQLFDAQAGPLGSTLLRLEKKGPRPEGALRPAIIDVSSLPPNPDFLSRKLEALLAESGAGSSFGELLVRAEPKDLSLKIDGVLANQTPSKRLRLHPGVREIVFWRAGYEAKTLKVPVTAGELATLDVKLDALRPDAGP